MKVLVTGGMGFIGSHLCERLLADGHQVTVVDDLSTGRAENLAHLTGHERLRSYISTIRNKELMERLLEQSEVVYHLAAVVGVRSVLSEPLRCLETNIRGTDMLLELAHRHGVKVMLASSSEVYGKSSGELLSESSNRLLGPTTITRWIYSTTKAVDECLALAYWREKGLPVVVMRFFNTVGPRQTGRYGMVLPTFVQQALRKEPITVYGDGSQTRCFTYVADAVRASVALAECQAAVGEVFNIGGTEPITIGELAKKVKAMTGSPSPIQLVPYEVAYGDGFEDIQERVPDISKLRSFLGYVPEYRLDRMIWEIIAYFRDRQSEKAPVSDRPAPLLSAPTLEGNACQGW